MDLIGPHIVKRDFRDLVGFGTGYPNLSIFSNTCSHDRTSINRDRENVAVGVVRVVSEQPQLTGCGPQSMGLVSKD